MRLWTEGTIDIMGWKVLLWVSQSQRWKGYLMAQQLWKYYWVLPVLKKKTLNFKLLLSFPEFPDLVYVVGTNWKLFPKSKHQLTPVTVEPMPYKSQRWGRNVTLRETSFLYSAGDLCTPGETLNSILFSMQTNWPHTWPVFFTWQRRDPNGMIAALAFFASQKDALTPTDWNARQL